MRYYSRTEPVGYAFHASLFCAACGEHLPDVDPEGNAKHPIAPWETSELVYPDQFDGMDVAYSCDTCGIPADVWGTLR